MPCEALPDMMLLLGVTNRRPLARWVASPRARFHVPILYRLSAGSRHYRNERDGRAACARGPRSGGAIDVYRVGAGVTPSGENARA